MEGYDLTLIGSFFGYPAFARHFGIAYDGGYQVPANWQVALTTGSTVGAIVGKFSVGYLIERFGYKLILLSAYAAIIAFVFILFFAPSLQVLLVGEVLCGLRGACSVILDLPMRRKCVLLLCVGT